MSEHASSNVVAALIWYKQTPERLYRCVKSLEGSCDGVVALDGPFAGLEGSTCSPRDNYDAIADAADEIGLTYDIFECQSEWRGEPEKRTAAARAALEHWHPSWVLVLDSDEWITTPIDWSKVLPLGHGTARIHTYRGDKSAPGEGGDGARMVRLFPNTPSLLWGPRHFDVRDRSLNKTYSGWEKALSNEDEPCMTIGHDLGEKVIQQEYESYNDARRLAAEGAMMRVVEDYTNSDRLVVRMDEESVVTGGWEPGLMVSFPGALVGIDAESGYAEVVALMPVPGVGGALDIVMAHVPDAEAKGKIEVRAQIEIAKRQIQEAQLAKRMRKRARRADRMRRA